MLLRVEKMLSEINGLLHLLSANFLALLDVLLL
jgi:hypothetical protein